MRILRGINAADIKNIIRAAHRNLQPPKKQKKSMLSIIILILAGVLILASFVIAWTPCAGASQDVSTMYAPELTPQMARGLTPAMVSKVKDLVFLCRQQGIHIRVISGYRTKEEQAKLYAQARTTPGKIVTWKHHSKHMDGEAVDIAVIYQGHLTWDTKHYEQVGKLGKSCGMVWGGDWKVRDMGHFETATRGHAVKK